jgi:hypothetical protein
MSASHYRELLQHTLVKLQQAQSSAREWQTVASNRLLLLVAVDAALNIQVYEFLKIGTIFGVSAEDPNMPVADLSCHSADEVTSFILQKIKAAAAFTANLTNEASSLQDVLSSTLSIALESRSVERPIVDLAVKDYTAEMQDATTPLRQVFSKIEDLVDDHNNASALGAKGTPSVNMGQAGQSENIDDMDESGTSFEMSKALGLFKRR